MKRGIAILLALVCLLGLCGCGHEHTWEEATCTQPMTCSECGKTQGEPNGHQWTEATCETPRTCSVCGETEGEPLGHSKGSWETIKEPTICSEGKEQVKCTRCGKILETRAVDAAAVEFRGGHFNFTRDEFVDFLSDKVNSSYTIGESKTTKDPYGGHMYYFAQSGTLKSALSLIDDSEGKVTKVIFWGKEKEVIYISIYAFSSMCGYEATEKSDTIFNDLDNKSSCTLNGLNIRFKNEGSDFMSFTITGA